MPTYDYHCTECLLPFSLTLPMDQRDDPVKNGCPLCDGKIERSMVYNFSTKRDHASQWPYKSDALVPTDPKMEAEYRKKGWLVSDGAGGETVNCESERHYEFMLKQQNKKQLGDYQNFSRSRTRHKRQKRKMSDRPDQKKAIEKAKKELREKGLIKGD